MPESQANVPAPSQKDSKLARPKKKDPLLQALIERLPEADTDWPVDKQMAWLNLMAMAFGTVYGGNATEQLAAKPPTVTAILPQKFGAVKKKAAASFPFMIDEGGYVMKSGGQRVNPADVSGQVLYDMRGMDGDLGKIIWADDTVGLNGADVMINSI